MTPPVPASISGFAIDGYVNALTRLPSETRLFGTESLYGDWNGRCLLLAKDFTCASQLEAQIAHWPRGYSHNPRMITNERLRRLADPLRTGEHATSCGLLYGSALGPLCRADKRMSGALPNRAKALSFGEAIVRFTLSRMPNLRVVVCLGREAWECVASVTQIQDQWARARDASTIHLRDGIAICAAYHPAARVSAGSMRGPWQTVYETLGAPCAQLSARAA
jgi:hypothetical protein